MVIAALGAVLAVFGTAATSGVHDGTEVEVVAVELLADFVSGGAEFIQVFAQKADGVVASDLVAGFNNFVFYVFGNKVRKSF